MKAQRILLVLFLSACDGGSKDRVLPDSSGVDSSMPDAPPPPNAVAVDTFGETPVFIRYRNGDGPWLEPTTTASGYEFRIDTHYELLAVCGDATNGFDIGFEGNTYEESGGETFLPCFGFGGGGTTHAVTGTMVQPGRVMLGAASDNSPTGNWTFQLDANAGLNDLLAVGNGRMQLQKNVNVTGAMTLPSIDVQQNGVALGSQTITLNNLATGDMVRTNTYLLTQTAFFQLANETGSTARVAPAGQLSINDAQFVIVNATSGRYSRSGFKRHTAAAPASSFTLLPQLENAQLANGTATWTSLPDGGRELYIVSGNNAIHRFVTDGWLGTKTSLAIDTEIPGFMPEWKVSSIDLAQFEVNASQGGASLRTGIVEAPSFTTRCLDCFVRGARAARRAVAEAEAR